MAYKIQYSPETAYRYPQQKEKRNLQTGRWLFLAMILAAAVWLRVKGVPDFLIPGDPEITRNAVQTMVTDNQGGAAINDAVTAFCRTILHGAGV